MKSRFSIGLVLLGTACLSAAQSKIINNPTQTISLANPGTYYFNGSYTSSSNFDRLLFTSTSGMSQEDPRSGLPDFSIPALVLTIVPEFQSFVNENLAAYNANALGTLTYTGRLFSFVVAPTTVPGVYDTQALTSFRKSYVVFGTENTTLLGPYELTKVTVTPVPEPASMAALALGAVALVRRRKKA